MAVVGTSVPHLGNVLSSSARPFEVVGVFKKPSFFHGNDKSLKPKCEKIQRANNDDHLGEKSVAKRLNKEHLSSLPGQLTSNEFSTKNDSKVRIAFKGLPGSYSEDACLKAYPNGETIPCDEFEDAVKAVELWVADKAILPIENSCGGSIHRSYDLLLRHRLHIVGEVQLTVNLCLLALPGIRPQQLKRVLSHPQALDLCETYLSELGVVQDSVDDASGAAQYIASNGLRDFGAIASTRAAEIYGLNVVAEKIQEDFDNVTRYLILARDPILPGVNKPFKTSIVFTLEEGPGVLFKALGAFAVREINLTKIESRPQRKRPLRVVDDDSNCTDDDLNCTGKAKYFDYLFYIDFEASMAEPRAQNALENLQEFATFIRVLGCYAMDTTL